MILTNSSGLMNCLNDSVIQASGDRSFEYAFVLTFFIVPVITILGLCTNGSFLYVIYWIPNMRTSTNFYLANLAVSDGILLLVSVIEYNLTFNESHYEGYQYISVARCVMPNYLLCVCSFASTVFVTLVALERYQAVCEPLRYRYRSVSTNPLYYNIKCASITWIVLLIVVVAPISAVYVESFCKKWLTKEPLIIKRCTFPAWTLIVLNTFDVCEFFFALLTNVLVYLKIVITLSKQNQQGDGKSTVYVARMLCVNAIVFFICLLPIQLSNIEYIYQQVKNTTQTFYGQFGLSFMLWIGRVGFLVNSTVNPIIYNVTNQEYRKAFQKAFTCGGTTLSSSMLSISYHRNKRTTQNDPAQQ